MEIVTVGFEKEKEKIRLKGGDVVYCKADKGSASFYGIYSPGVGVIDLEYGSSAYMSYKGDMYVGQKVNYWTIEKICNAKVTIEK